MQDEQRLKQKFYALKRRAIRNGEDWEMTVDDFIRWGTPKNIIAPNAKYVLRTDTNEPWAIGNLTIAERPPVYGHVAVSKAKEPTTITKKQWIAELRAVQEASGDK
ncbi:hypothetical protein [Agrobacterium tumefaciens]|uniref:hypothetical protein n=1 Tax=Agrobacterium tumefaciens TaxID=358 RepID=UPI002B000064|nr:hypothetical protein [Agrobacterium tumefaciens]MEA1843042.1 hypothetical protein [Agrobacterium tumefaciens]